MLRLQARLSANVARLCRGEQAARRPVPEAPSVETRADAAAQHVRGAGAMTVDVTSRSSTATSSDFPLHHSFLTDDQSLLRGRYGGRVK
jgi:hypothetical protein